MLALEEEQRHEAERAARAAAARREQEAAEKQRAEDERRAAAARAEVGRVAACPSTSIWSVLPRREQSSWKTFWWFFDRVR